MKISFILLLVFCFAYGIAPRDGIHILLDISAAGMVGCIINLIRLSWKEWEE